MAGTVPALSMTMQFDKDTGKPMAGGKLYFYEANTTLPQNAFQDTGLTLPLPNPVTLDGAGRIPEFYVDDGNIHVRLTNALGVVQLDAANTLVVGPSSSGGGSSGGSVDPTAIFQTGDELFVKISSPRPGWVRQNGNTIGNAGSGAEERANADTQALFTYLWTHFAQPSANAKCPVVGGLGPSAAGDYAASKQITLPDMRGRSATGLDDMGALAAGVLLQSNITSVGDTVTTAGATGGEANHTLTQVELPAFDLPVTDPGHEHDLGVNGNDIFTTGGTHTGFFGTGAGVESNPSTTGITVNSGGGGLPHDNMAPFALGTWYVKL